MKYLFLSLFLLACSNNTNSKSDNKYEATILTYPNREMVCKEYYTCDGGFSLIDCEDSATGEKWDFIRCVPAFVRKVQ